MKTTYINIPLLKKGYPTPFWIASAGIASTIPAITPAAKKTPLKQMHLTMSLCIIQAKLDNFIKYEGNDYA